MNNQIKKLNRQINALQLIELAKYRLRTYELDYEVEKTKKLGFLYFPPSWHEKRIAKKKELIEWLENRIDNDIKPLDSGEVAKHTKVALLTELFYTDFSNVSEFKQYVFDELSKLNFNVITKQFEN